MIETIDVQHIEELIKILNQFPNHYVFRGHADSQWSLQSTLERTSSPERFSQTASSFEKWTTDQFQSKFQLYCHNEPKPNTQLEWLALMQHFGIPTRLLDFSESPYVALYFAIEGHRRINAPSFSVTAIDYQSIINRSIDIIKNNIDDFEHDFMSISKLRDSVFKLIPEETKYSVLWITEPKQSNPRLDRQSGTFLFPSSPTVRIEPLLKESYQQCDVKILRIPNNFFESIYALLRNANVNAKALYGDLYGLAASIRLQLDMY